MASRAEDADADKEILYAAAAGRAPLLDHALGTFLPAPLEMVTGKAAWKACVSVKRVAAKTQRDSEIYIMAAKLAATVFSLSTGPSFLVDSFKSVFDQPLTSSVNEIQDQFINVISYLVPVDGDQTAKCETRTCCLKVQSGSDAVGSL